MRVRSHKFPRPDEIATDTTYYDEDEKYLDIGYQRLKIIDLNDYSRFKMIKKLYINNNCLTILPAPENLPHLNELDCCYNQLNIIPFYPNLEQLKASNNNISSLSNYHDSKLEYLDISHNNGFILNIRLPECRQLYITHNTLTSIDLGWCPKLQLLDCGYNEISEIRGIVDLIELNIEYNNITALHCWPNIQYLNADYNKIQYLKKYPRLLSLNIQYNKLIKIDDQPLLERLIANNNNICELGIFPKLKFVDLSYNRLQKFEIPPSAEHIYLQFNCIKNFCLEKQRLLNAKEIQIDYNLYKNCYRKYYDNLEKIQIQPNRGQIELMLNKLHLLFDTEIINLLIKNFSETKFYDRYTMFIFVSKKIYQKYFNKNIVSIENLLKIDEFQKLLSSIAQIYYRAIIVTLYFNEYEKLI